MNRRHHTNIGPLTSIAGTDIRIEGAFERGALVSTVLGTGLPSVPGMCAAPCVQFRYEAAARRLDGGHCPVSKNRSSSPSGTESAVT